MSTAKTSLAPPQFHHLRLHITYMEATDLEATWKPNLEATWTPDMEATEQANIEAELPTHTKKAI